MSGETDTLRLGGRGDNGDDGPGREGYGGVRCGSECGSGRGAEVYRGSLRVRLVIGVVLRVRVNVTDVVPTVA